MAAQQRLSCMRTACIMNARTFWYPGLPYTVTLSAASVDLILRYRQRGWFSSEAGGLLFAKLSPREVSILEATPPQKRDRRSGSSFQLHLPSAQALIDDRFATNMHYVGEWHTHPQRHPKPSKLDYKTMASVFEKSNHQLNALIFLIAGTGNDAMGLWCGAHRNGQTLELARRR